MKKIIALLLSAAMCVGLLAGCGKQGTPDASSSDPKGTSSSDSSLKGKRVRVVIGSTSTGGDSYMTADIVTRYLSEELGFNGKVDAIGNAAALDAISKAEGDGTTIMMFHDMTYLSVMFGAVDQAYALENLTVGPRIGQNPGGCFAAKADAPYDSIAGAAEWLKNNPGKVVRVNIEAGSVSNLAFDAYWMWVNETFGEDVSSRLKAVVGGTTDEKKQRLWDGNCDIIYGDYSSFVEFTKEGVDKQLALKMMDPADEIEGVDLPTMADNGVTFNGEPYVFAKDFAMYFPKDMDENVLNEITAAMQKVCEDPDFQAEMSALKYKAVPADQTELSASQKFIMDKRATCTDLVASVPPLDSLT